MYQMRVELIKKQELLHFTTDFFVSNFLLDREELEFDMIFSKIEYAQPSHRKQRSEKLPPRHQKPGDAKRYSLKVIMLGDYGVGKTTLARCFHAAVHGNKELVRELNPRLFYEGDVDINDDCVTLRLIDTAGQERYRSITSSYYRGANCCLLVFNTSNKNSFHSIGTWFDDANRHITNTGNVTFILVGVIKNAQKREVTKEQCENFADYLDIPYTEVDTKNESTVLDVFKILASTSIAKLKRTISLSTGMSTDLLAISQSDTKVTILTEKVNWKCSVCAR